MTPSRAPNHLAAVRKCNTLHSFFPSLSSSISIDATVCAGAPCCCSRLVEPPTSASTCPYRHWIIQRCLFYAYQHERHGGPSTSRRQLTKASASNQFNHLSLTVYSGPSGRKVPVTVSPCCMRLNKVAGYRNNGIPAFARPWRDRGTRSQTLTGLSQAFKLCDRRHTSKLVKGPVESCLCRVLVAIAFRFHF
jgi:hypothetical protein